MSNIDTIIAPKDIKAGEPVKAPQWKNLYFFCTDPRPVEGDVLYNTQQEAYEFAEMVMAQSRVMRLLGAGWIVPDGRRFLVRDLTHHMQMPITGG